MEMTIYKHRKDWKLYMFHTIEKENGKKEVMAIPVSHDGKPIVNCDTNDFVLHSIEQKQKEYGIKGKDRDEREIGIKLRYHQRQEEENEESEEEYFQIAKKVVE